MRSFEGFHKGVNLGGWLSQCGMGNYNKEHYDSFMIEKDIALVNEWGLDHVRVPVDAEVIQEEDGTLKEDGLAYIDRCIEWCRKYGLHMVLDLHKAHGYVFDDSNNCQLFYNKEKQNIFVDLWVALTQRYGKDRDILVLELLNEVTSKEYTEPWNKLAERTIKAIREKDCEIRIIVGGIYNDSIYGLTLLNPPMDENIVFTFHCYSPLTFTYQGANWVNQMPADPDKWRISYPDSTAVYKTRTTAIFGTDFDSEYPDTLPEQMGVAYFENLIQPALQIAEKYNVPLYCGEYGVIDLAEAKDALAWFQDFNTVLEKYAIPRAVWSHHAMNFGLADPWLDGVRNQLLNYL